MKESLPKLFERLTSGYDQATITRISHEISGEYFPTDSKDYRNTVSELLELRSLIDNTISSIEEVAESSLKNGEDVFGYTLQKGRTSREIINEERMALMLNDLGFSHEDIYETKMRGIPHIETLLKAKNAEKSLGGHIRTTTGEPKLKRI